MEDLRSAVLDHFQQKMIATISVLQGRSDITSDTIETSTLQSMAAVQTLDGFGDEVLRCCVGSTLYKVKFELCIIVQGHSECIHTSKYTYAPFMKIYIMYFIIYM